MSADMSNAIWLARRQILDQWPAFLVTAVYFAFMGAVLAADESYAREFANPMLMLILIQPALSSRYLMTLKRDNDVVRHQVFLRSLPLSLRTTVIARLFAMLAAGVINVPLYFSMFWIFGDLGLSVPQFIGWVTFWVGIALVGSGLSLVQEFWLNLRRWTVLNTLIIVMILLLIPFSIWVIDFRPVQSSINAAGDNAWLMALIGIVLGVTSVIGSVLIAERLYARREFIT